MQCLVFLASHYCASHRSLPACSGVLTIHLEKAEGLASKAQAGFTRN